MRMCVPMPEIRCVTLRFCFCVCTCAFLYLYVCAYVCKCELKNVAFNFDTHVAFSITRTHRSTHKGIYRHTLTYVCTNFRLISVHIFCRLRFN